jgi:hypothetical protein
MSEVCPRCGGLDEPHDPELEARRADLAERLLADLRPFYIRWLEGRQPRTGLGWIGRLVLLAFGPYALWALAVTLAGRGAVLREAWYVLYVPAIVMAGLALLHYAHHLVVERSNLTAMLRGLCEAESLTRFERDLRLMWVSRGQVIFLAGFGLAAFVNLAAMRSVFPQPLGTLPEPLVWAFVLLGVYALVLAGPGVWLACTSLLWANGYASQQCLRLRGMHPHRHMGLRTLAAILGAYALSFSLECSLCLSAFYAFPWRDDLPIAAFVRGFWVCLWVPFIVAYFGYPQYRVARVVHEARQHLLNEIAGKVDGLFYSTPDHDLDTMERILKYNELLEKLQSDRAQVWDLSAAYRFLTSLIAPLLVFAIQNPDSLLLAWEQFRAFVAR